MSSKGGNILVVDDDREINAAITEFLVEEGYKTAAVFDGKAALEWLRRKDRPPCLVLLDLMMPVMTGEEVLRTMRASADLIQIPVIVMSASIEVFLPGVTARVRKPFEIDHLLTLIEAHHPRSN